MSFREVLYLLLCGTGVGFSVESKFINQLPDIEPILSEEDVSFYVVDDSREGWADAIHTSD